MPFDIPLPVEMGLSVLDCLGGLGKFDGEAEREFAPSVNDVDSLK